MVIPKTTHRITGTLIWYYYICKREVWLMARQIVPNQDNQYIELGRFIDQDSYKRDKRMHFSEIAIDLIKKRDGNICVGEVKKSSRAKKSAKMQLAFYLLELKSYGVEARGELLFPKEKKKEEVLLDEELEKELKEAIRAIDEIISLSVPPGAEKCTYCYKCAYGEFCWA